MRAATAGPAARPAVVQAARIIEAAWVQDDDWGALVWLVMVTAVRHAELLALRWSDVDLDAAVVTVRRNYVRVTGSRSRRTPRRTRCAASRSTQPRSRS